MNFTVLLQTNILYSKKGIIRKKKFLTMRAFSPEKKTFLEVLNAIKIMKKYKTVLFSRATNIPPMNSLYED